MTVASRLRDAPAKVFSSYDAVFSENCDNKLVYESVVAPLVQSTLQGFNTTVFCYGQTGTGKTHTMEGGLEGGAAWSADHPESGMIPRAVRDIFTHLQNNVDSENSVRVSHLEVANEELVDLLASSDDKPLRLFEHPKDGVVIHNLESVPVNSVESIFKILRQSNARRAAAATKLNAASSRSHCVFTITVQTKETAADGELIRMGRMHLIDLAGSENVAKAGTDKATTGGLNQSLLVLGRVIMALAEKRAHVPTRESKLTRLMADSLGGKHITSMIGCITQAASSYDETMATLEYALAARKIKNKPEQNARVSKKVAIKEYLNEIEKLKAELRATREKNGVYMAAEEFKAMEDALKATRERVAQLDSELGKKGKQLDDTSSMLATTQERLRDTSSVLQATEADLADTRAQLAETQSTLEQTQDALEETGEVVRVQSATEKVLHRNATGILKTLDVRESEVDNLHGKIARKNAIEDENRAISSSFRQYVGTKVEDMSTQLKKFRASQTEQFSSIKNTVHTFMEDKTKEIETLTEKLDTLQETLGAAVSQISGAVATFSGDLDSNLREVDATAAEGRAKASDALQTFMAAAKAQVEKWRAQLQEERGEVTEWGVNTAAALQMALQSQDEFSTSHSSELSGLKQILAENTAAYNAWAEEHRKDIAATIKAHKERTEKMQRDMTRQVSDLISGYVAAQQKALAANAAAQSENVAAHGKSLFGQHDVRAKHIDTVAIPAAEARQRAVAKELSNFSETLNAQYSAGAARIESDKARANKTVQLLDVTLAAANKQATDNAKRSEAELEQLTDLLEAQGGANKAKLEELVQATGAWRDEASEMEMVSRSSVEETKLNTESQIKALETATSSFGDKLVGELMGTRDQFHHYFDSLKEDVPTGSTPQKRVLSYPQSLPAVLSDEEIISRGLLGSVAAAAPKKSSAVSPNLIDEVGFESFRPASVPSSETPVATPTHASTRPSPATGHKSTVEKSAPTAATTTDKKALVKAQRLQQAPQQQPMLKKQISSGPARNPLAPTSANIRSK